MPNFNLDDAFCTTTGTPSDGDNIDMSTSTVLDGSNLFTVNTYLATGNPLIEPGTSSFNGFTITEVGDMKAKFTDCDGDTTAENTRVVWFTTTDGNTYYIPPDEIGDMHIDTIHVIGTGVASQILLPTNQYGDDDDQVPCVCFAAEMLIDTQDGAVAAGDLNVGDMVLTKDKGFQPVRWIYKRQVRAVGVNTPVLFQKGSIGNDRDLIVSQKHRFYTGALPATYIKGLANNDDHLIHADCFVNGVNIRLMPEQEFVTYVHIMFEDHELVHCQGTVSESWQPTRKALKHAPEVEDELLSIFPEIATRKAIDPGCMVRPQLVLASRSA